MESCDARLHRLRVLLHMWLCVREPVYLNVCGPHRVACAHAGDRTHFARSSDLQFGVVGPGGGGDAFPGSSMPVFSSAVRCCCSDCW